jgi:hypothetical protein
VFEGCVVGHLQREAARAAKGTRLRVGGPAFDLATAPADVRELIEKMDGVADELGLAVSSVRTGRNYQPLVSEPGVRFKAGIGVYSSGRGVELNLSVFRELGANEIADDLLQRLREVTSLQIDALAWPAVPYHTSSWTGIVCARSSSCRISTLAASLLRKVDNPQADGWRSSHPRLGST